MPLVTVRMMEGVLSIDEKNRLMQGITDAVVKVYGLPMRLFVHVVLEEIRDGNWTAAGSRITADRVRKLATAVGRTPGGKAAARGKRPGSSRRRPAS